MKNKQLNTVESKIGVLDTSISSMNVGDYIIMDSAYKRINSVFDNAQKVSFPTHERINRVGFKRQKEIAINFLCGTNCLNSKMMLHRQWNVGFLNSVFMKDVITLGVGWQNYQGKPDFYTKTLLKRLLSRDYLHSVRDNYTLEMLQNAGISNVINTSCPTMWDLTEEHCAAIPSYKSENVIFTLTDYREDKVKDLELIKSLLKSYNKVYFWVQGSKDYVYFNSFGDVVKDIIVVPPNLYDFDKVLNSNESLEYIGTRLHAGIRALQKKRRSIIISVDNRAEEKKKDFNLKVIPRDMSSSDYCKIYSEEFDTKITLPNSEIEKWKTQFK